MLLTHLHALNGAIRKGQLNEVQKREVYATVSALPDDGLDWVGAWAIEVSTGEDFLQKLRTSTNPGAILEEWGTPVPKGKLAAKFRQLPWTFKHTENMCSQRRPRWESRLRRQRPFSTT